MAETMAVKSNLGKTSEGGFPVAIHDKSDEYVGEVIKTETDGTKVFADSAIMDGELFIADDKVHNVPKTGAVMRALGDQRLVEAGADEKAGDTFEPGLADISKPVINQGDTAADLEKRYTREQLNVLADENGIDATQHPNKTELAQAIFDANADKAAKK